MAEFVFVNGQRMTPWMAYQIGRLDHDIYNAFGVRIVVNSAIRLPQEQLNIWYDRYVTSGNVRGRKVYDTRWWRGQLWYRISPAGTVAQPGTSNHEVQGSKAAVDIADTGSDSGIMNKNSKRGKWLRANLWRYGMVASGDGFGEGWHMDILNIFNTPPTPPAPAPAPAIQSQEDDMPIVIDIRVSPTVTHRAQIGKGLFGHLTQADRPDIMQDISGQDRLYEFGIQFLPTLLRKFGCDPNIWDFRDKNDLEKALPSSHPNAVFVVLDPLTGKVDQGNTWTDAKQIRADLAAR